MWNVLTKKYLNNFDIEIRDHRGHLFPRSAIADFVMVLMFEVVDEINENVDEVVAFRGSILDADGSLTMLGTSTLHNTTMYLLRVSTKSSSSTQVEEGIGTGIEFKVERRDTDNIHGHCGVVRVYGAAGIPGTSDYWNMTFRVRSNDTINEPMTIMYNCNVGTGTDAPAQRLDVYGRIRTNLNGGSLQLVGTDHTYIEYYPDGTSSGRNRGLVMVVEVITLLRLITMLVVGM